MSMGIYTLSQADTYLMHTDVATNMFFKSNGTYLNDGSIGNTNFLSNFALSTPTAPLTWSLNGIYDLVTTAGAVSSDGVNYLAPTPFWISDSGNQQYSFQMQLAPAATHIYAFGTTEYANGFGFACNSPNQSIAVSEEYKGFSIHNNSSGARVRTGTANSLSSDPGTYYGFPSTQDVFSQPTGINIVFDKPYDSPPLIFIVETSWPIALNFMSRDGNGKYVGAEIIAAGSVVATGNLHGSATWGANTATFTYFIVSSEAPQYPDTNNYGMQVFNSSNECIFDSSAFIPSIRSLFIAKPYFCIDADRYYRSHDPISFGMPSSYYGVCINNFSTFSGTSAYPTFAINDSWYGVMNFCGRYIGKNSTTLTLQGLGTLAFMRPYMYPGNVIASWDFNRGGDEYMPVLYANYVI